MKLQITQPLVPIIIGTAIGLSILVFLFSGEDTKFIDAGLGLNTSSAPFDHKAGKFFCTSAIDVNDCINESKKRSPKTRILWLGASQLYGINQRADKDRAAPWSVFDRLNEKSIDVITVAQANGYPEEHRILFEFVESKIKLDGLVLGLVYDDMREMGIRPSIQAGILDINNDAMTPKVNSGARSNVRPALSTTNSEKVLKAKIPIRATLQEKSEAWLTTKLENCCGLETLRAEVRGQILLMLTDVRRLLETLRARHTRDLSQYRVSIPAARYKANRKAIQSILERAREKNTKVLLYIAPRPTDFFPYDPNGYTEYKKDMMGLAKEFDATLVNLEDLVPNNMWGLIDLTFGFPVRDPFHFQGKGHLLLADEIISAIEQQYIKGGEK